MEKFKKYQKNTVGSLFFNFSRPNFAADSKILQESVKIVILSHSGSCTQFIMHSLYNDFTFKEIHKKLKYY